MTTWLSQWTMIGWEWSIQRSEIMYFNHCSLKERATMERYSASIKDRDIVGCFLVFHDIELEPNMVKEKVD